MLARVRYGEGWRDCFHSVPYAHKDQLLGMVHQDEDVQLYMHAQEVWDSIELKNPQNLVGIKKYKMAMVVIYHFIP